MELLPEDQASFAIQWHIWKLMKLFFQQTANTVKSSECLIFLFIFKTGSLEDQLDSNSLCRQRMTLYFQPFSPSPKFWGLACATTLGLHGARDTTQALYMVGKKSLGYRPDTKFYPFNRHLLGTAAQF